MGFSHAVQQGVEMPATTDMDGQGTSSWDPATLQQVRKAGPFPFVLQLACPCDFNARRAKQIRK